MIELVDYVELEKLKATLSVDGPINLIDDDLQLGITAGSRAIDEATYRYFGKSDDEFDERFFTPGHGGRVGFGYATPSSATILEIDDLVDLTLLDLDVNGDGEFETTLELNRDFHLEPLNAAARNKPYERIVLNTRRRLWWPPWHRSVRVTGQFGWPTVPAGVVQATGILASRLAKRARETPYAIAVVSIETGSALRIIQTDPDVAGLLDGLAREVVLA